MSGFSGSEMLGIMIGGLGSSYCHRENNVSNFSTYAEDVEAALTAEQSVSSNYEEI